MKPLYIYILLFILIMVSLYFLFKNKYNEPFTPHIRQMYRPHIRNARIYTEGFYNKHKNNVHLFLRKFGII